jgi:hypothetical protein
MIFEKNEKNEGKSRFFVFFDFFGFLPLDPHSFAAALVYVFIWLGLG